MYLVGTSGKWGSIVSAECEKHGLDLHGDTVFGLICPVCECELRLTAAELLLREIASYQPIHPLRDKARAYFPGEDFDTPMTEDYKRARGAIPASDASPEEQIRRLRDGQ